jgi:hypothetical protein
MRKILSFTVAILIAGSAVAAGDIWRWKDANGTWHYSDQPQQGAELVSRAGRAATDRPTVAAPPAPPAPSLTTDGTLPVSGEVAAQVRKEAAATKSQQCEAAKVAYQKLIEARVVSKPDEKGNKTYLTDAEIDAERLRVRGIRDTACGPGA